MKRYYERPVRWENRYVPGGEAYSVGVNNEGYEVTERSPPIKRTKEEIEILMTRALNSTSLG